MKTKNFSNIFLCIIIVCVLFSQIPQKTAAEVSPAELQSRLTLLEELNASFLKNKSIIEVKGAIKNVANADLRGFITIYLIDKNDKVIVATDESLNGGQVFKHGIIIPFEVTIKIPAKMVIDTVSVDFTPE